MAAYFARRLLLLIPTFVGITMLVFCVTRFVPGGPIDQMIMQARTEGSAGTDAGGGEARSSVDITPAALRALERHYHFDWPLWRQYLHFIGPLNLDERGVFGEDVEQGEIVKWIVEAGAVVEEEQPVLRFRMSGTSEDPDEPPPIVSREVLAPASGTVVSLLAESGERLAVGAPLYELRPTGETEARTIGAPDLWTKRWSGLLAGDLGVSYSYDVPVGGLIVSRFPISLRFGLIGFLLAYLVCIPLGVLKAVRHTSYFDLLSSAAVFVGYSIPGWALGAILLVLLGGGSAWDVFPLGGIHGEGYETFTAWEKVVDSAYHMVLPVIAYAVGSFAILTVLMKNSLMEQLGQDYVRTAFAKGLSERRVILVHALRNSLIPICTGLGHALGLLMAGSYLIEKVFNIHGIGLLGFTAIESRDYAVVMGVLVINTLLVLLGNILSDILYVLVDPRIRFS